MDEYTVFVRVPRPRGDFVDPPPVHWDSAKDAELLKILYGAASHAEIDWNELAERTDSTVPFLLQLVPYLNNRNTSRLKGWVRKGTAAVAKGPSATPSPVPGGEAAAAPPSGHHRTASALSLRRDSPMGIPRHDAATPTANRPDIPRNTSGNALAHISLGWEGAGTPRSKPRPLDIRSDQMRLDSRGDVRPEMRSEQIRLDSRADVRPDIRSDQMRLDSRTDMRSDIRSDQMRSDRPDRRYASPESIPASPVSDSDSDDATQSRIISRPPVWDQQKAAASYLGTFDEEDDEPVFQVPPRHPSSQDLTATLRGTDVLGRPSGRTPTMATPTSATRPPTTTIRSPTNTSATRPPTTTSTIRPSTNTSATKPPAHSAHASDSSSSSVSVVARPNERRGAGMSFRNAAEIAARHARRGVSREGSEGTPSMGSSYSDLEGSVTRSELEEYVGNLQDVSGLTSRSSLQSSYNYGR